MNSGRVETVRELLFNHGFVIGRLFSKDTLSEGEHESFIRYGSTGMVTPEPRHEEVDAKLAEFRRTGVLKFDGE